MPTTNTVTDAAAQRRVDLVDGSGVRRCAWLLFVMAALAAVAAHTGTRDNDATRGTAERSVRGLVGDIGGGSLSDLDQQARELRQTIAARASEVSSQDVDSLPADR